MSVPLNFEPPTARFYSLISTIEPDDGNHLDTHSQDVFNGRDVRVARDDFEPTEEVIDGHRVIIVWS